MSNIVIGRPRLAFPEEVLKQKELYEALLKNYAGAPHLNRAIDLVANAEVSTRHSAVRLEDLFKRRSFGDRNKIYASEVVRLGTEAGSKALEGSGFRAQDIDYLVVVSCTGFMLPGPDAYIAANLGCRADMRRISLQQLGCAAGVAAISSAARYIHSSPGAKALVIAVELPSLSYRPEEFSPRYLASVGIFADGAAAAVVANELEEGFVFEADYQHLLPNSQKTISSEITEQGIMFEIDPRIPKSAEKALEDVSFWLTSRRNFPGRLDFCVAHTGGPTVIKTILRSLDLPIGSLDHTRASLREIGNTESVSVFDVLKRHHDKPPNHGDIGIMIAFGPGFTTEAILGSWRSKEDESRLTDVGTN